MKFMTLILALSLVASGCAEKSEPNQKSTPAEKPQKSDEKPTPGFIYKRLVYGTEGTCGEKGFFFKTLKTEDQVVGKVDGRDVVAESTILLHANNLFEVEYVEKYVSQYMASGYRYSKSKKRYVSGHWEIQNDRLVLGDLMEIVGQEKNHRGSALVTYKQNLITAGLKDAKLEGGMVAASAAIRSERETCPVDAEKLGLFDRFKARQNLAEIQLSTLRSNEFMVIAGVAFQNMEVVLREDGHYEVVASAVFASGERTETFIIDSGFWERNGAALKLYNGWLRPTTEWNEAVITFARDLTFYVGSKHYTVPLKGRSIGLKYGASMLTMDDLTYTYQY